MSKTVKYQSSLTSLLVEVAVPTLHLLSSTYDEVQVLLVRILCQTSVWRKIDVCNILAWLGIIWFTTAATAFMVKQFGSMANKVFSWLNFQSHSTSINEIDVTRNFFQDL